MSAALRLLPNISSPLTRAAAAGSAGLVVRDTATPTSSRPFANFTATSRGSAPKLASTKRNHGAKKYPFHLVLLCGLCSVFAAGSHQTAYTGGHFSSSHHPARRASKAEPWWWKITRTDGPFGWLAWV